MGQSLSGISCTIPITVKYTIGEVQVDEPVQAAPTETTPGQPTPAEGSTEPSTEPAPQVDEPKKAFEAFIQSRTGAKTTTTTTDAAANAATAESSDSSSEESSDDSDDYSDDDSDEDSDEDSFDGPEFVDDPVMLRKATEISMTDTNDHTAVRQANLILNNGEMDEENALQAAIALSELDNQ